MKIDTTTPKGVVEFFETYYDRLCKGNNNIKIVDVVNEYNTEIFRVEGKIFIGFAYYRPKGEIMTGKEGIGDIKLIHIDWYAHFNIKE